MSETLIEAGRYLSPQEKYYYKELFKIADARKKLFLWKQEAIAFFSSTRIPNEFLEEIWESADEEDKEYITEAEFYIALKLIACAQNGIESSDNILATQVPLPQFRGITIRPMSEKPLEIRPIAESERENYIGIFQSCNLIDGLLYGDEARSIFMKSRLPTDKLNAIWRLADTRNSGTLNKTEFIIAMHYISRLMSNPSLILPRILPSQTYAEATGRFATSIRRYNTMASPTMRNKLPSNVSLGYTSPVISNTTTSLTSFNSSMIDGSNLNNKGNQVVLTAEEIEQYKPYFIQLDTDGSGFIEADEAVYFFSHSRLPDSELSIIWKIADSRHLGKLDLHDFSVAMHLIGMRKNNQNIDKYTSPITQQPFSNQSSQIPPQEAELLHQRYELENQLVEIKQQAISQQKLFDTFRSQLDEAKNSNADLQTQLSTVKYELEAARKSAEEAEHELKNAQQKKDRLLGHETESVSSTQSNTPKKSFVSSLPELTRAPSTFSGSSILSPRSDIEPTTTSFFDTFSGFKKSNQQQQAGVSTPPKRTTIVPVSPMQAKVVSKYGFDITTFDALSLSGNDTNAKTSVNDDLASLFGPPVVPNNGNNTSLSKTRFDDVFM